MKTMHEAIARFNEPNGLDARGKTHDALILRIYWMVDWLDGYGVNPDDAMRREVLDIIGRSTAIGRSNDGKLVLPQPTNEQATTPVREAVSA